MVATVRVLKLVLKLLLESSEHLLVVATLLDQQAQFLNVKIYVRSTHWQQYFAIAHYHDSDQMKTLKNQSIYMCVYICLFICKFHKISTQQQDMYVYKYICVYYIIYIYIYIVFMIAYILHTSCFCEI